MAKKRIRITVEHERVLIARRREALIRGWCERCDGVVEFVPAAEAGGVTIEGGGVGRAPAGDEGPHSAEAHDGPDLVCLPSLLRGGRSGEGEG